MQEVEDTAYQLKQSSFLQSAPDAALYFLAEQARPLEIKAGETVFEIGDTADAMYIITSGSMSVHEDGVVIKHLSQGEAFGEIAALTTGSRTASVTADVDCHALRISQDDLYEGISRFPETSKSIIHALCAKGREVISGENFYALKADHLEKELQIAHNIQRSFLPETTPEYPGWQLLPYLKAARQVAGDFYDFFETPYTGKVGFVIGDVCDKGLSASLFMTLFRTLLHSITQFQDCHGLHNSSQGLGTLLKNSVSFTNRYISQVHGSSNMFATLFIGLLDITTGELTYINAGHEPPVIVNNNQIREQLETNGPIVGMFMEAEFEPQQTILQKNDIFVSYTDGVTEAKNTNDDLFTEEKLIEIISSSPGKADQVLNKILGELESFVGEREQYDDTTLLIIERN